MATSPQPSKTTPILATSFVEHDDTASITALGEVAEEILRAKGGDMQLARGALIEAVRAGRHVELSIRAVTFRQKEGHPNKNFVRHRDGNLPALAASFVGKPFLLNHNKWDQEARMGTITESEAAALPGGWTGFRQTIRVVKPHAVISVLDGTIDAFSIGWSPNGALTCTVHKVDVLSRKSCMRDGCRPGRASEVDGGTKIAEYEYQSARGTETSSVNAPAVDNTKIEGISQLAEHLGLSIEPDDKESSMTLLTALAAVLGAGLTEENAPVRIKELADGKLAAEQERDAALAACKAAEAKATKLETELAASKSGSIDAAIELAYKAGKLIRGKDAAGKDTPSPREARLRRIGGESLAELEAELAEMAPVIPVGQAVLKEEDPTPRAQGAGISKGVLASQAAQLGLKVEDVEATYNQLIDRT